MLVAEELGGCLLNRNLKERIEMEMETGVAPLSSILRVHDFNYVMKIMKACSKKVGFVECHNHRQFLVLTI